MAFGPAWAQPMQHADHVAPLVAAAAVQTEPNPARAKHLPLPLPELADHHPDIHPSIR